MAVQPGTKGPAAQVYGLLTGRDASEVGDGIPPRARAHQPRNFLTHAAALAMTKSGDALIDPKLVLAWLLGALGAPGAAIGALVPIREALALLPQLFIAPFLDRLAVKKYAWAVGSTVQGGAVLAMAATAVTFEGAKAGWCLLALLAVFALGRSICSASYKAILGRTVASGSRGTATGTAGSIAAATGLAFGLLLSLGIIPLTVTAIATALLVAGGLWLIAASLLTTVVEDREETGEQASDGAESTIAAWRQFNLVRQDRQFARFILARALLTATALSPPFMVGLAGGGSGGMLGTLGPFVIASALASVLSAYVWGRLSDRSSRRVLVLAGLTAAAALAVAAGLPLLASGGTVSALPVAAALFALMVAYQGVRSGRSTHLVDMAPDNLRAAYTAVSNSIIGIVLIAGAGFGFLADAVGLPAMLAIFSAMSLVAAYVAAGLDNVQQG